MVLSTFTVLCSHHLCLVQNFFITLGRALYHQQSGSISPLTPTCVLSLWTYLFWIVHLRVVSVGSSLVAWWLGFETFTAVAWVFSPWLGQATLHGQGEKRSFEYNIIILSDWCLFFFLINITGYRIENVSFLSSDFLENNFC